MPNLRPRKNRILPQRFIHCSPLTLAVAAVLLLLFSTIMNYYFFTQYRKFSNKYEELASSQIQMASANQVLQTKLQDYESAMNMMKDPAMAIIKMNSVPTSPSPNSLATV